MNIKHVYWSVNKVISSNTIGKYLWKLKYKVAQPVFKQ